MKALMKTTKSVKPHEVDKKWHIVVDHFHKRERRRIAMLFFSRVEYSYQRLAFATLGCEFEVVDGHSRHDLFRATLQIFDRDVNKVLAQVALDLIWTF